MKQGMADMGIGLSSGDLQAVFNHFDRNKDGHVDYNEFLRTLRVILVQKKAYSFRAS